MERELYALWPAVVKHDRCITGLKVFVYTEHKNNMFQSAALDNRRIAKNVSNWATELPHFDLERQWIRGEAHILGDAPSRAPEEMDLWRRYLPIPSGPVHDIVSRIYSGWDQLNHACTSMAPRPEGAAQTFGDSAEGREISTPGGLRGDYLDRTSAESNS